MHRLRCQAQVRAHRNGAVDQELDRVGQPRAAFDLDHVRAGLDQLHGIGERHFRRRVATEGHVGQDHRALAAARHGGGVVGHFRHGDRQRGGVAIAYHAQRVADQQDFHAAAVHQAGEAGVVAREHGDLGAGCAQRVQRRNGDSLRDHGFDRRRGLATRHVLALQITAHIVPLISKKRTTVLV